MSDLPLYKGWSAVPVNLATKTTLGKEGLRLAKDQAPAARVSTQFGSKKNVYDLYDKTLAIPKRQQSEKQKAALEKAKQASKAARTCKDCGRVMEFGRHYRGKEYLIDGYCEDCHLSRMIRQDHRDAFDWAAGVLQSKSLILDTETTGLYNAEIIQIGITDVFGNVLMNELIKPQHPERLLEADDRGVRPVDIHGIMPEMLEGKPTFADIYPALHRLINGREVIIWNVDFDLPLLNTECDRYSLEQFEGTFNCAMRWYSAWWGDWSHKYEDYRFQALGGNHDAVGDCLTVIERLKEMAHDRMPRGPKSGYEEFLEQQAMKRELDYWRREAATHQQAYFAAQALVRHAAPAEAWPKKDQECGGYRNVLISVPEYLFDNLKRSVGLEGAVNDG